MPINLPFYIVLPSWKLLSKFGKLLKELWTHIRGSNMRTYLHIAWQSLEFSFSSNPWQEGFCTKIQPVVEETAWWAHSSTICLCYDMRVFLLRLCNSLIDMQGPEILTNLFKTQVWGTWKKQVFNTLTKESKFLKTAFQCSLR